MLNTGFPIFRKLMFGERITVVSTVATIDDDSGGYEHVTTVCSGVQTWFISGGQCFTTRGFDPGLRPRATPGCPGSPPGVANVREDSPPFIRAQSQHKLMCNITFLSKSTLHTFKTVNMTIHFSVYCI